MDAKKNTLKTHYYWLDLLRFIAAFLVLAQHARQFMFPAISELPETGLAEYIITFIFYFITRFAHYWVIVFFVLSGFLVGGRVIERLKKGTFDARNYFIDRFVRISLPLVASLLLVAIVNSITGVGNDYIVLIGNLFSLQGIAVEAASGPFWSLSYEVWLYLIMGLGAMLFMAKNNRKISILFFFLVISTMVFLRLNFVYGLTWFMGAIAYQFINKNPKTITIVSYIVLAGMVLGSLLISEKRSPETIPYSEMLFALFVALLLKEVAAAQPKKNIAFKTNKIGTNMAKFSYTLYLTHYPILYLALYLGLEEYKDVTLSNFMLYLAIVIICVIVSYLIYLVSEKHTDKVKQLVRKWVV